MTQSDPEPPTHASMPRATAPDGSATGAAGSRPRLDDRQRKLDPRALGLWRATVALATAGPFAVAAPLAFVLFGRLAWAVVAVLVAVLLVALVWYPPARYERWRWRLTPIALELRYGVLIHRQESVPYFRIQQIDIARGPLDRLVGLSSLLVTTASASGSARIPGLAAGDAPNVRAELLARATDAVAEHGGGLSDAV